MTPPAPSDPVLQHARREAIVIVALWLAAALFCCLYSYEHGYLRPGRNLGAQDLRPILGMPRWFFWGIVTPWVVCCVVSVLFAAFGMVNDDLGTDHAAELDADIREGAEGPTHG